VCPWCGETFYDLPLHDSLRKHIDYCSKRPESVNDDDNA